MIIRFTIPTSAEIANKIDLTAQAWHTQNVYRRMLKYMPMETGMFSTKQTVCTTKSIITTAPQAYYLYYGVRMVDSKTGKGPAFIPNVGYRFRRGATLVPTSQPLNYTTLFHPLAGPKWDERLMQAEGDVIAKELETYINTRA